MDKRHIKRLEKSIDASERIIENLMARNEPCKIKDKVILDVSRHLVSLRNQLLESMKGH